MRGCEIVMFGVNSGGSVAICCCCVTHCCVARLPVYLTCISLSKDEFGDDSYCSDWVCVQKCVGSCGTAVLQ